MHVDCHVAKKMVSGLCLEGLGEN